MRNMRKEGTRKQRTHGASIRVGDTVLRRQLLVELAAEERLRRPTPWCQEGERCVAYGAHPLGAYIKCAYS